MKLSKYILDLLYRYELVIIPDLGGFLVKSVSAKIDERSNTIHPPSKRLGFNTQLTANDGLLANHIASVDKIPYETALNFIKFEISELLEKIKDEDVELEGIGAFSLNAEGNLLFEPNSEANFATESFGLSSVVSTAVTRDSKLEESKHELEVVFDSILNDEYELEEKDIAVNSETTSTGISPLLKYAASFALLLSLGYIFWQQYNKGNDQTVVENELSDKETKQIQEATFEISDELEPISIKIEKDESEVTDNSEITTDTTDTNIEETNNIENSDENLDVVSSDNNSKTKEAPATEKEEVTKAVSTDTKEVEENVVVNNNYTGSYHVIAGAFKDPNNATKKVNQLTAKGFDAHIVGINKWDLTQVAFASYTSKSEAQTALNKIKVSVESDAWILKK